MDLKNLIGVKKSLSRSISAENMTGEKGRGGMATEGMGAVPARDLGRGWKVSPCVSVPGHSRFVLADIRETGIINHIWCTCSPEKWRSTLFRIFWDGAEEPSVQTPLGDFFCCGWNQRTLVNSLAVTVNPAGGFNSYWQMPFRSQARVEIENLGEENLVFYYQIDYELCEVPAEMAYFHAFWHRSHPLEYKAVHPILEIQGTGHYVGTYLAYQANSNGWWGEGEMKFFLDGDREFPSICGTGTEDYFGGAWNFEEPRGQYGTFSTAYQGLPQVIRPDGLYQANQRFGMYRWHLADPIRFETDLKVTLQALGWRSGGRYLPLRDDIASVAFWYQTVPCKGLSLSADPDELENI